MQLKTDRDKVAHILRRFGLGASEAEIEYFGKDGLKAAVDRLLDPNLGSGFEIPIERFQQQNGNFNMQNAAAYTHTRLICSRNPLLEKVTLFWHNHFAVSAQKVDSPAAMIRHMETLRQFGLGRFEDLLLAVSRDPAMIYWLDNQLNKRGKPNENFAREVMELFTLGIGNYSEKDVQEAARAFTGWGYGVGQRQTDALPRRQVRFIFDPRQHDAGVKEILGNKGPFSGEDVIGILVGNPRTSEFIVTKFWSFFVYEKPEPALVQRLAKRYRETGLRTDTLIRMILESPEFYSDKATRQLYKSPADFCVTTLRQLGLGRVMRQALESEEPVDGPQRGRQVAPAVAAMRSMKAMGMELLFPPDVAGWDLGAAWISTATMVERMKWADRIFGTPAPRQVNLRFPIQTLLAPNATPRDLVETLMSLFDANLPPQKVNQIVQAVTAEANGNLRANIAPAALTCTRLLFASPEFQFC